MAKTESTAVNDLIDLVKSGKSQTPASEPSADLFAAPPAPKTTTVNPPRMTSPIPAMRGAGDVAPLPRARAPHSTSEQAMPSIPAPAVRMSTADPSRGNTIPPLSRPTSGGQAMRPSQRGRGSGHGLPAPRAPRGTSQPSLRTTSSQPQVRSTPIAQRTTVPSVPSLPPPTAPVAAPFEARREDNPFAVLPALPQQYPIIGRPHTIDATGDIVRADNWFDVSAAVARVDEPSWDGTAVVQRPRRETMTLVGKLVVPTIILAIVGIMVGGFFAFDGDGGKKKTAAAESAPQGEVHQMPASAPTEAPSAEAANVATLTTGVAQAEPPTKAEELAKQQAAAEAAKQDAAAEAAKPAAPASESMFPAATTAVVAKTAPGAAPAKTEAAKAATAATAPAATAAPAATKPAASVSAASVPTKVEVPVAKTEPAKTAPTLTTDAPIAVKSIKTSGQPTIREVQTPKGVLKFVDVRINSKPAGATVMLVDNGKTSFLGTTPLATSIDPSRSYEVIFTYAGRPTQMAPLDPSKTSRLDVTLGRSHGSSSKKAETPKLDSFIDSSAKPATPAKADTATVAKVDMTKPEKVAKVDMTKPESETPAKAEKKVAEPKADKKADAAGQGTLMVSSKPPCEIMIDGKATGLSTPQKAIPLPAGVHKVTFVNEVAGIKKTVSVSISADQPTKLIQDLMKK